MQFMAVFIAYPWAAIGVAAVFAVLHVRRHRWLLAVTAGAWLLYGLYEYLIHFQILCEAECNIRVDLLLIYPVLIVLSLAAIIGLFIRR